MVPTYLWGLQGLPAGGETELHQPSQGWRKPEAVSLCMASLYLHLDLHQKHGGKWVGDRDSDKGNVRPCRQQSPLSTYCGQGFVMCRHCQVLELRRAFKETHPGALRCSMIQKDRFHLTFSLNWAGQSLGKTGKAPHPTWLQKEWRKSTGCDFWGSSCPNISQHTGYSLNVCWTDCRPRTNHPSSFLTSALKKGDISVRVPFRRNSLLELCRVRAARPLGRDDSTVGRRGPVTLPKTKTLQNEAGFYALIWNVPMIHCEAKKRGQKMCLIFYHLYKKENKISIIVFAHICINEFWRDLKDTKNSSYRGEGMDRWMDGWMDRWMDGWLDR